ncbi:hypothetical protein A5656_05600 [Mycobacterium gordonae]|nr:HK97 gp10 family phage protein [Mycobacterium gordonae]OBK44707.1 hypothetical protein A5656_05600 [Mycobacterium gordonae]
MALGFEKFGISDAEIEAQIAASAEVDGELNRVMEDEIVPYWRQQAPVDTGAYASGVRVTKKARGGKGQVGATHFTSHFIEDGTGGDTPTPEFAPGQKTAAHFGGTLNRGEK